MFVVHISYYKIFSWPGHGSFERMLDAGQGGSHRSEARSEVSLPKESMSYSSSCLDKKIQEINTLFVRGGWEGKDIKVEPGASSRAYKRGSLAEGRPLVYSGL